VGSHVQGNSQYWNIIIYGCCIRQTQNDGHEPLCGCATIKNLVKRVRSLRDPSTNSFSKYVSFWRYDLGDCFKQWSHNGAKQRLITIVKICVLHDMVCETLQWFCNGGLVKHYNDFVSNMMKIFVLPDDMVYETLVVNA
jgi:hypothetical protein